MRRAYNEGFEAFGPKMTADQEVPVRRICLILAGLVVGSLAVGHSRVRAAPESVTFSRDVAPIVFAKCASCHRTGEVAPMPLLTFQDARPFARAIKERVSSRQMPPWFADPAIGN